MNNIQIVITGDKYEAGEKTGRETKAVFIVHDFYYTSDVQYSWMKRLEMVTIDNNTGEAHSYTLRLEDTDSFTVDYIRG